MRHGAFAMVAAYDDEESFITGPCVNAQWLANSDSREGGTYPSVLLLLKPVGWKAPSVATGHIPDTEDRCLLPGFLNGVSKKDCNDNTYHLQTAP